MMFQGELVSICVTGHSAGPMQAVPQVRVVPSCGLEGDRYFAAAGTFSSSEGAGRQVTLIESEAIEAACHEYDLEVAPLDLRRNLITREVPLNHLVGRSFMVGEATLRGVLLCEPCGHLEKLTCTGIRKAFVHRGGLRAEILTEGIVRVGDIIRPWE